MIAKPQIRRGLLLGAIYLVTAFAINELQRRDMIGADASVRIMGVLRGLIALILANGVPKSLVPLENLHCDPVREQSLRRFAARLMVVGSLGYTLAYVFAPITMVHTVAIWLFEPPGLVFVAILARCAWVHRKAMRNNA